jgi:hypothetical protein
MPNKNTYTLTGDDIVEHIYNHQEMGQQTRNFFHWSPLWRAIRDHISGGPIGKNEGPGSIILIDPPVEEDECLSVRCYRGSGYAIRFRDAAIYGFRGESPHVEVRIEVEWEGQYETFERRYTIRVPVSLCKDFTQEAFDEWISAQRTEKKQAEKEADIETLKGLVRKWGIPFITEEIHE